jgi:hypothetical protein
METLAFFEKKVNLTPKDLNDINETTTVSSLLEKKIKRTLEKKCSEHGFVIPDSVKLISHSVGYFEPARFTGDAVYYVKAEGQVLYPADGIEVDGEVIRKNKMGLYLSYREGLRIQVPRDLNLSRDQTLSNEEKEVLTDKLREDFEKVEIGDIVRVTLKKSLFQINDGYILTNGIFIGKVGEIEITGEEEAEAEAEVEADVEETEPGSGVGVEPEEEEEEEEAEEAEEGAEEEAEEAQVPE